MSEHEKVEVTSYWMDILIKLDKQMETEKRKYNLNSRETILYETIREILKSLDRVARGNNYPLFIFINS